MKKIALLSLGMLSVLTLVGCGKANKLDNGEVEFEGVPVTQELISGKAEGLIKSLKNVKSFEASMNYKKEKLSAKVKVQGEEISAKSNLSGKIGAGLILGDSLATSSAYITTENFGGSLKIEGIPSISDIDIDCNNVTTAYYLSEGKVFGDTKNELFQGLASSIAYELIGTSWGQLPESTVKTLIKNMLAALPEKAYLPIPNASSYKIDTSNIFDTTGVDFTTVDTVIFQTLDSISDNVKFKLYNDGNWGLNFKFDVNSVKKFAISLGAPEDIVNRVASVVKELNLEASFKFDANCRPIYIGSKGDIKVDGNIEGVELKVEIEEETDLNFAFNSLNEIKIPNKDSYQEVDLSSLNSMPGFNF